MNKPLWYRVLLPH